MHDSKHQGIESLTSNNIYDVLIVGAGPVGLAIANGLQNRGIENFLVIDRARTFRKVGRGIDLLPNGLKALKYLEPKAFEEVKRLFESKQNKSQKINFQTEVEPKKATVKWLQRDLNGKLLRSTSLEYDDWKEKYGEGRLSIGWYDLQTILRNQLPQEKVKANHCCVNIVEETKLGYVQINYVSDPRVEENPYAHWENEQKSDEIQNHESEEKFVSSEIKSLQARIVIAVDGINSTLRKVLYHNKPYHAYAQPVYSGFAAISCMGIIDIESNIATELEEKFFQSQPVVTVRIEKNIKDSHSIEEPKIILFRSPDGQIGYVIHAALSEIPSIERSKELLLSLAINTLQTANFPNSILELVRRSPLANMEYRPYYINQAIISNSLQFPSTAQNYKNLNPEIQPPWHIGRVVLGGDAAHGMPPFTAQGANQGLEDAAVLTSLIEDIFQKNLWNDSEAIALNFKKYERIRRPVMIEIQQATLGVYSFWSEKELEQYNQKTYGRDFAQIIGTSL